MRALMKALQGLARSRPVAWLMVFLSKWSRRQLVGLVGVLVMLHGDALWLAVQRTWSSGGSDGPAVGVLVMSALPIALIFWFRYVERYFGEILQASLAA